MADIDRITAIWRECLSAHCEHVLALPRLHEWTDVAKTESDDLEELDAEF